LGCIRLVRCGLSSFVGVNLDKVYFLGLFSIEFVQRGIDWIGFRWFKVSHFRSVYSYLLQQHFSCTLCPSQFPAATILSHKKMDLN
jgi:hypothetical protein